MILIVSCLGCIVLSTHVKINIFIFTQVHFKWNLQILKDAKCLLHQLNGVVNTIQYYTTPLHSTDKDLCRCIQSHQFPFKVIFLLSYTFNCSLLSFQIEGRIPCVFIPLCVSSIQHYTTPSHNMEKDWCMCIRSQHLLLKVVFLCSCTSNWCISFSSGGTQCIENSFHSVSKQSDTTQHCTIV